MKRLLTGLLLALACTDGTGPADLTGEWAYEVDAPSLERTGTGTLQLERTGTGTGRTPPCVGILTREGGLVADGFSQTVEVNRFVVRGNAVEFDLVYTWDIPWTGCQGGGADMERYTGTISGDVITGTWQLEGSNGPDAPFTLTRQ